MPDFKNMPRQRGLSDTPVYQQNPRKYARTRCEKAINACDRIIMYMGELIQNYSPEDMLPTDVINESLKLADWCNDKGISIDGLIDLAQLTDTPEMPLGKFTGYLVTASLLMRAAKDIQASLTELRSSI